jgi:2-polyprenyl-6-methoxyphenol hydroxylase-like FAD-dependent oxidoreductase
MHVLIIGRGVAGLCLAAKLARQDREPVVVEKSPQLPGKRLRYRAVPDRVGRPAWDWGLPRFRRRQCRAENLRDRRPTRQRDPLARFSRLMALYRPIYLATRATLIRLLRAAAGQHVDLRMGTTVTALREAGSQVEATLSDGSAARFDLVVGGDGIGSPTREQLFGPQPGFDTGWTGWTWWDPRESSRPPPHANCGCQAQSSAFTPRPARRCTHRAAHRHRSGGVAQRNGGDREAARRTKRGRGAPEDPGGAG